MAFADDVIRDCREAGQRGQDMGMMPMRPMMGREPMTLDVIDLDAIAHRHHGLGEERGYQQGRDSGIRSGEAAQRAKRDLLLGRLLREVQGRSRAMNNSLEVPRAGKDLTKAVIRERAEKHMNMLVAGIAELTVRVEAGELDG